MTLPIDLDIKGFTKKTNDHDKSIASHTTQIGEHAEVLQVYLHHRSTQNIFRPSINLHPMLHPFLLLRHPNERLKHPLQIPLLALQRRTNNPNNVLPTNDRTS